MTTPRVVAPDFAWPLRVYWEDTDAGGIVFYANYLKFFERARTEWLRSMGIEQRALREQTGGMFVVVDTNVRYHRPARLDDELLVTTALQEKGRVSLTIVQQALSKTEHSPANPNTGTEATATQLLCEGVIRIGWVDGQTLKPARIPPSLFATLPDPFP
jgi:acyl-CoA thioester hydrolase